MDRKIQKTLFDILQCIDGEVITKCHPEEAYDIDR